MSFKRNSYIVSFLSQRDGHMMWFLLHQFEFFYSVCFQTCNVTSGISEIHYVFSTRGTQRFRFHGALCSMMCPVYLKHIKLYWHDWLCLCDDVFVDNLLLFLHLCQMFKCYFCLRDVRYAPCNNKNRTFQDENMRSLFRKPINFESSYSKLRQIS